MSSKGHLDPQLAKLFRDLAAKVEGGEAGADDAAILRRLATAADGTYEDFSLQIHPKKGGSSLRVEGIKKRFAMAKAIAEHRNTNGGTLEQAFEATCGAFNVKPDRMQKVWKEMGAVVRAGDDAQRMMLQFMVLDARGKVQMKRVRRGKNGG